MTIPIEYMLESLLCSSILYSAYFIMLRKSTKHNLNRLVVITILLATILMPLVKIESHQVGVFKTGLEGIAISADSSAESDANAQGLFDIENYLVAIYIGIAVLLISRIGFGIYKIMRLESKAEKLNHGNWRIYIIDEEIKPFSFFSKIFINRKDAQSEALAVILEHERVHVRMKHSLDMILIELVSALYWYNPIINRLKSRLKELHEFEADSQVIANGIDEREYKLCIVNTGYGDKIIGFANNFNDSVMIRRLKMMEQNSTKGSIIKQIAILPVMAMVLFFVACEEADLKKSPKVTYSEMRYGIMDNNELDEQPVEIKSKENYSSNELKYPAEALKAGIEGDLVLKILINHQGKVEKAQIKSSTNEIFNSNALEYASALSFEPGKKNGKAVDAWVELPISFRMPPLDKNGKENHSDFDTAPQFDRAAFLKNFSYPSEAKIKGYEAKVIYDILVDKGGKIEDYKLKSIITSQDGKIIDSEEVKNEFVTNAESQIQLAKFTAAEKDGKKVKAWVSLPITYKLADKK